MVDLLSNFSEFTGIYTFMNSPWGWPTAESIHFLGLAMLIGTVVLGYFLNLMTGIMFLTTAPDQYIYNPAFQTKLFFMFVAGLNVFWFYTTYSKQVKATDATNSVVEQAKLIAGLSLLCWTIVIICGRLITYFRPPYHWCWLC